VLHDELEVMLLLDKVGCSSKPLQERDMASNLQEIIQDCLADSRLMDSAVQFTLFTHNIPVDSNSEKLPALP
jgi:hypothetical protein